MPEFVNPFSGKIPMQKLSDRELARGLRLSLCAEEEAVHLYEALADATDNQLAKAVLQDIANEEKVHKGEFQRLIELLYKDETNYMNEGALEVDEMAQQLGAQDGSRLQSDDKKLTIGNLKNG
jgi:rubrerythrin